MISRRLLSLLRTSLVFLTAAAFALPAAAQYYQGTLDSSSPTRDDGKRYEQYDFDVRGAREIVVHMESTDFDTYLIVQSPSGVEQYNDDFGSQEASQLTFWATEEGRWLVHASEYGSGSSGQFTLEVVMGRPAQVAVTEGRLDYRDQTALKGERYDLHEVVLARGESATIELVSFGFDGYLVAESPSGTMERNDDAGSTELSRIGPLTEAGKWRIYATSNMPDEQGAYDLRVIRTSADYRAPGIRK